MSQPVRATIEEARVAPIPPGFRSSLLMQHGSMKLRYYAPRGGTDPQTPHDQDELYVIASGRGTFFVGGQRVPFGPGDVLFVGAKVEHRFEDFSDDFATWVVFYGPPGGERA
jgi:mannose-6-phosphate isomerase-like protein (cupin superfamily)